MLSDKRAAILHRNSAVIYESKRAVHKFIFLIYWGIFSYCASTIITAFIYENQR